MPLVDILPAIRAAGEDADRCKTAMVTDDSQFARRMWVRAYFAWVEIVCFSARQYALYKRFGKRVIRPVDIPEFSALSELRYTVTAKGDVAAEPAHGRTLDYIVFSFVAFAKTFGLRLAIDRGDRSWEMAKTALRVRDRITHPKSSQAFNVSDDDVKAVEEFAGWFAGQLHVFSSEKLRTLIKKEAAIAKRTRKKRTLSVEVDSLTDDA